MKKRNYKNLLVVAVALFSSFLGISAVNADSNALYKDVSYSYKDVNDTPSINDIIREDTSYDNVEFSWEVSGNPDGYNIYYKESKSEDFIFLGSTTEKSYVIKDLLPLREYDIKVAAFVNSPSGDVDECSSYTFTILAEIDYIENLNVQIYNTNSAKITWDKVKDATGYYVYYKKMSSNDYTYLGKTSETSYYKSNLSLNTTYMFKVVPYILVDGKDVLSGSSVAMSAYAQGIDISKLVKVSGVVNKTYTGKYRTLDIKVTYKGKRVPVKVTYKNNKNIGKAYVTIKMTGDYVGTVTKSFYIVPSKTSISRLKSTSKKKALLKYSSVKGNVRYQVAYKRSGSKSWSYAYYSNSYAKTIKNLKSKKKYTFKVRAYKKVNGKYIYGAWSNTRSVIVR